MTTKVCKIRNRQNFDIQCDFWCLYSKLIAFAIFNGLVLTIYEHFTMCTNIGGVYVLMTSVYVVEFVFEYSVFHARAMPYTALLFLFLFSAKLSDDAHICFIAMLYIQIYTLTIYLVVMFFFTMTLLYSIFHAMIVLYSERNILR